MASRGNALSTNPVVGGIARNVAHITAGEEAWRVSRRGGGVPARAGSNAAGNQNSGWPSSSSGAAPERAAIGIGKAAYSLLCAVAGHVCVRGGAVRARAMAII